jgi:triacylglycerol lipase
VRGETIMYAWLIRYTIKWVVQGWIIAKIAKYVRRWLVKKYSVEHNFQQNSTKPHNPDWHYIKWFAEFATYAYKREHDKIKQKYKDYDIIYVNTINEIQYILLADENTKTYYISIRGTSNSHNALQDINFLKDKSFRLGIHLHTGFHRTAEMIADDLLTRMDKTWSIYVTGHSLGGAAALIVAWYLDFSGYTIDECITFGQPKVTDSHGVRALRGKIKHTRVVNETDVVPLVPPAGTHMNRYAHGGELIKLLDHGKFCYLEEPDSLNYGVNSFWLWSARESFSFYEMGKELPDHYMTSYIENIDKMIESGEEVLWKDRLQYIEDSGLLGEFADEEELLSKVKRRKI